LKHPNDHEYALILVYITLKSSFEKQTKKLSDELKTPSQNEKPVLLSSHQNSKNISVVAIIGYPLVN
jgi:hypothetical protein